MPALVWPRRPLRRLVVRVSTLVTVCATLATACAPIGDPDLVPTTPPDTATPFVVAPTADSPVTAPPTAPVATERAETATPTARPAVAPTLGAFVVDGMADQLTAVPTAVAGLDLPDDVVNVLLIGTDGRGDEVRYRTDTLILASIRRSTGDVTLVSIPRDLYVMIPLYGMERINVAFEAGERINYPGGGLALLDQTLLYNLGLPVHFHASVNFDGFKEVVDALGGIDVPVTCPVRALELADQMAPERQGQDRVMIEQSIGLTHMDGARALWYARVRPVGGDYFRNYRQRQVLRAIVDAGMSMGAVQRIPELYTAYQDIVHTDLGLWDVMGLMPLAAGFSTDKLRTIVIGPNQTTPWTTPRGDQVLLPRADAIRDVLAALGDSAATVATPTPTADAAATATPTGPLRIEIVNATGNDLYAGLALEVFTAEGFAVEQVTGADLVAQTYVRAAAYDTIGVQAAIRLAHVEGAVLDPALGDAGGAPLRLTLGQDYVPCPRLDWLPP